VQSYAPLGDRHGADSQNCVMAGADDGVITRSFWRRVISKAHDG